MTQADKLYGLDDWEKLECDISAVVERVLEDAYCEPGEDVFAKIEWPLRINVFRRMELPEPTRIARWALERVLENLDEQYSDPEGSPTEPNEAMAAAALAFAYAVRSEYVSWGCERTGEVIEYTEDQAREEAQ